MAFRELLPRLFGAHAHPAIALAAARLAAVAGRETEVADVELDRDERVGAERRLGVGHLEWVREQTAMAAIAHVVEGERLAHLEAQAAGVVSRVAADLRPLEH